MDFVTTENLCVGHHNNARRFADESSRERTYVQRGAQFRFLAVEPVLRPDLLETLAFTVVIAKHVYFRTLAQPAMQLIEEFPPLRLGDLRFRRAIDLRAERFETREERLINRNRRR